MRKSILFGALFVASVFAAQTAKADDVCNSVTGNLVQNCGFELDSNNFVGWSGTVIGDGAALPALTFNPYSGDNAASFGPPTQDDTLFQSLNTVAGTTYTIQFALANDTSPDPTHGYINNFSAAFGSTTGFSETNALIGDYVLETFTGVATGSSTNLTFSFENQAGFFYLDSISVAAVPSQTPEPSSLVLLGTGVVGFAGAVRRRLKQ